MPWTTLGLDPAGATERDVKRAYAKLLKDCRPDQNPEGFRKLHDAYQAALHQLQWQSYEREDVLVPISSEIAPDPDDATSREVPEVTQPMRMEEPASIGMSSGLRAITDCFDRLNAALAGGSKDIQLLVEEAESLLYDNPSEVERWGELMQEVFVRHGENPAVALKADTIVFELEHGGFVATLAVIDRLDRNGSPQGIANLSNLLHQNASRIATPAAGIAAARLAGAAAFWTSRHTERLANFAYEQLARGERDFHMQLIDRHVAMAHMMTLVPDHLKSFWRQRLMRTAGRDTWSDEESRAAIEWLKTPLARRGPCFEVFLGLLPEDLAAGVKNSTAKWQRPEGEATSSSSSSSSTSSIPMRRSAGHKPLNVPKWEQDEPKPKKRREYHATSNSGSGIPGWLWGFAVFVAIKLILLVVNMSKGPDPVPVPRRPLALEDFSPEERRRVEEGAKRLQEAQEKLDQFPSLRPLPGGAGEVPTFDPFPKSVPGSPESKNPLFQEFESKSR
ncbi:J domain-containing protein [Luteolibacter flavescens]|uniref:J domain-containing protein n=1 Tax=Luteolibacter flavescens TaxID=1859460 RepID=A0ABT3FL37_9BACT|nr:J domain-containing protein [Luteolibacter flavescens]MCW1883705.1 J domain-containing protein [Luteolibacter flavescens]